ncbi:hypothetical protein DFQ27_009931 [Actinomortierella ambigua]|uniref:Alcohol dehydrogenase-like C-terminal domain-containing protein n=1 Tax=Actinomortierella ambigua TaxID=1343610 RepID=A0A9P6UA79_9FUNG|nr:hypothetical protein DFQ27_009931 [Actinomortierella ambigua]
MSQTQLTFKRVLVNRAIQGEGVRPSKSHFRTITVTEPVPELQDNEVFLKNLSFGHDTYIIYNFPEGETESRVRGYALSRVLDSKNPKLPKGSLIFAPSYWEEYTHLFEPFFIRQAFPVDQHKFYDKYKDRIPLATYNGILGMSGFTGWGSLEVSGGDLKPGQVIYIPSAAGTLGQLVGQLLKRKGLKVIGSAGSQAKIDYLTQELGFDFAFNYKEHQDNKKAILQEGLAKIGAPGGGLDIFYDLVGDETVDVALELLNPRGRVIAVGFLSNKLLEDPLYGIRQYVQILFKELTVVGHAVWEHFELLPRFFEEVVPLVAEGQIKYRENVLEQGTLEQVSDSYIDFIEGKYTGKVSVNLASTKEE